MNAIQFQPKVRPLSRIVSYTLPDELTTPVVRRKVKSAIMAIFLAEMLGGAAFVWVVWMLFKL